MKPSRSKKALYLWERSNTDVLWFSRAVPKHLWAAEGRKLIQFSLDTTNREEAAILVRRHASDQDERWGRLPKTIPRGPTDDEIRAAAVKYGHDYLLAYEDQRRRSLHDGGSAGWERHMRRSKINVDTQVRHTDVEEYALVRGIADAIVEGEGWNLAASSPRYQMLCEELNWARLEAFKTSERRLSGDLGAQTESPRIVSVKEHEAAKGVNIPFAKLVEQYLRMWKAEQNGDKVTNTEQQKRATFKLFGDYWSDKPIRSASEKDATIFRDQLKLLDPKWSRSPASRQLNWAALLDAFGDHATGLSPSTMNRHMATLQSLWDWARKRGHCDGDNPFSGFHTKIRNGDTAQSYRAWEDDELTALFRPPPRRSDLKEVMLVALFSGMRLNEIASLTWSHIRVGDDDTPFFNIDDAKTPAGVREVPVHRELDWLLSRREGKSPTARIWVTFNPEGPGKKPGADASREFSRFKTSRGFADRLKTFHSFRKNVTRIMERSKVPENEWAQVFGHERGFTYGTYNPDGIELSRKAEIIGLISYPKIDLPHPSD